jgi:hypothetical protein
MTIVIHSYDEIDDLYKSVGYAYRFIRSRVALGGKGWKGYPMNDGQPLIETHIIRVAEKFRAMADRIDRNPQEFGGACVIIPPGGADSIEFLLIDSKGDVAQFYGAVMTKVQVVMEEMKDQQRHRLQGFR